MPALSTFSLFLVTALVLLVTPGPAVLYIVARSIDQGRKAGVFSVLGVATGSLVHVAAAALGLSALLVSSAAAYAAVKYAGAAYLIFLGVRKFREQDAPVVNRPLADGRFSRLYWQGLLVNVTNPKTAVFFLALLPQFVDVSRGSVVTQVLVLGSTFAVMGIITDGTWALAAASVAHRLRDNLRMLRAQRYFAGSVFIGLGLAAAFSGSNRGK